MHLRLLILLIIGLYIGTSTNIHIDKLFTSSSFQSVIQSYSELKN
jgi:hypothetical protein